MDNKPKMNIGAAFDIPQPSKDGRGVEVIITDKLVCTYDHSENGGESIRMLMSDESIEKRINMEDPLVMGTLIASTMKGFRLACLAKLKAAAKDPKFKEQYLAIGNEVPVAEAIYDDLLKDDPIWWNLDYCFLVGNTIDLNILREERWIYSRHVSAMKAFIHQPTVKSPALLPPPAAALDQMALYKKHAVSGDQKSYSLDSILEEDVFKKDKDNG